MNSENTRTGKASVDRPWMQFYEGINIPDIPKQTIYDTIAKTCMSNPDRVAIEYFSTSITYGQLLADIDRTADAFIAAGVRPGDYVSLCMITTPESICSFYALAKIGAICNFVEPRCNPKRILHFVNDTNSRILVMIDVFIDKLSSIRDELNVDKIVIASMSESMTGFDRLSFRTSVKGRELIRKAANFGGTLWKDFILSSVEAESFTYSYMPDYVTAIVYSGGTTGVPKGATITHDAFNTMLTANIVCNPQMCESRTFLNIMPPFASYGLMFGHFMPLVLGMTCRIVPNFVPANFDKLVLKYKPDCVFGVPSFFEALTTGPNLKNKSLSFLKCIVTGGDTFNAATEATINSVLQDHGCNITVSKGYGMSEMGSAASYSFTSDSKAAPPGSAGIPLYCNNIMIIDEETGEELGYNCPGEVCMSGPTMTRGYINNEEATRELIHTHEDGSTWIHSGDIGYITEEGILYIVGRKKRMIIRPDGHKVWPSLIDQALLLHPAVSQCCTVGLPSPESDTGKVPTAFVVLNDGFAPSSDLETDLSSFSLTFLPERDIALEYHFIDSLPFTSIGKVDYRSLEKKYSA